MDNKFKQIWEKIKSFFSKIKFKSIAKGARITYGVVWNLLLLFVIIFFVGGVFAGGVGAGYFAALVRDQPVLDKETMMKDIYQYEETSSIYFANEIPLGKLRADIDREEVKIDEVSDYLKKAVIATEDEYFYEHHGVVPKALLRAVFQEFTNASVQTGGSTLTQQLIKNQILTNEVSFERKAKEVLLALRVERFLEKDEILEAYLNVSTFGRNSSGQNIGGVQAAARGIFGVDAKDLNLPQAAYIAGLPQSPFRYTPFTNKGEVKPPELLQHGLNRMKTVLNRMLQEEYITEEEYEYAINYDVTADFIPKQTRSFEEYPYIAFEVEKRTRNILIKLLAEKDGYTMEDLEKDKELYDHYWVLANRDMRQSGYHIHTTIHKDIYDAMQKAKDEYDNYGPTLTYERKNEETGETELLDDPVQIGAIMIENSTGRILSFVGGRDYEQENTNHAFDAPRQNGSTMKPLLAYGPAVELGKSAPGMVIADLPYEIPYGGGKLYKPKNFVTGRFYGLVSTREAIEKSHNASAISTYLRIFNEKDNPTQFLDKMGITTITDDAKTAVALPLGGTVTVEENVNAYTTFANGGQFADAYMIEKIVDSEGNVVYEHKVEPVEVFSPQTAYLMIDMMRGVFKSPGATAASVPRMLKFSSDWAGKTGTSNDFRDAWLIGSNPNITFGTWIGYGKSNRSLRTATRVSDSQRNYGIWAKLLNAAYDVAPDIVNTDERFKMPGGIVNRSYCAVSGMLPSEACQKAGLVRTDLFNAKYVPSQTDNSLSAGGRYILAGDKRYMALPSTPEEFTQEGLVIDPEFLKKLTHGYVKDFSQVIPRGGAWQNVVIADEKLEDDGKPPAAVEAKYNNDTISWSASSSKDVVGYRVYSESKNKIASIRPDEKFEVKVGKGKFYVVAVDVAGKESAPSNIVGEEEVVEPDPEPEKKPDKPDQKPDKPANGNNVNGGNGNGNGGQNNGNGNGNGNGNNGKTEEPADEKENEEDTEA